MPNPTDHPVRPTATVAPDDVGQPRRVEWGHLSQVRGRVAGDHVEVVRQDRRHQFGAGTRAVGRPRRLYDGSLTEALDVYRALDALFTGGVREVE